MKMKRMAALLAAALIIGCLGGCGGDAPDQTREESGGGTGGQDAQAASGTEATDAGEDGEKEIPTIVIYNNTVVPVAGAEAGSDSAVYKEMQDYILEQTGVKVEVILQPSDSAASAEKLNLLLAGGDQIDAWWGNWITYSQDGMILPLNEYVNAPEAKSLYELWEPWGSWDTVTDEEGTIWALPRNVDTTPYQIFVRNDWLELVGMDMPKTLDELNEYLYKVKEMDPFGNGETIPLLLEKGSATEILNGAEAALLGGYVKTGNAKWLDESDGSVKPEWVADGYKDFLAQLHRWYEDGIIHKETFTMNTDEIRQQISKGAVGATALWYSRVTLSDGTLRENLGDFPRDKYAYVFGISEEGVTGPNGNVVQTKSLGNTTGLLISSKCKHPEAVMKYMEWAFEWENYMTITYGLKDKYWTYNPDVENAEENKATIQLEGEGTYARDFLVSLGVPLEIQTTDYDDEGYQMMHNYWMQNHLNDFHGAIEPAIGKGIIWKNSEISENVPSLNDLNTYKDEEFMKFINGTRSLDTWDAFIQECYQIGLQDYIDEYTRQYKLQVEN